MHLNVIVYAEVSVIPKSFSRSQSHGELQLPRPIAPKAIVSVWSIAVIDPPVADITI